MKKYHLATAAVVAMIAASPAHATVVTDFNFDSLTIGTSVPTTAPGVDPQPQQTVYSVGGFQDDPTFTGTVTVQNDGTMSHAAQMTTNQGGEGALFVDTQFGTTGNRETISFDLDVLSTPATGMAQDSTNAPNGQAFAINFFGGVGQQRALRFVVAPTSAAGGLFGLRDQTPDGDINPFGTYVDGSTYHFEFDLNMDTHTLDGFMDGTQIASNYAFVDPVNNLSEMFLFENGVEGVTTSVAFDNLILTDAVPEPVTVALFGAGLAGMVALRRRKKISL